MTSMNTQNRIRDTGKQIAHRDYCRYRSRQIAYGRWQPWADAAPVRDHIRQLRRAGASYRAIAEAANMSPSTVRDLIVKCLRQGARHMPNRIGKSQAKRLLAITSGSCGRRNACGSRRRLQALVAVGYTPAELARRLAISPPRLRRLLYGETGRVVTSRQMVYEGPSHDLY
jgi:DNA-binding CsgD family transcriptional regulator